MNYQHSVSRIEWMIERGYLNIPPREFRLACMAIMEERDETRFGSDAIEPHEIPASASTSGWMRAESEHVAFLAGVEQADEPEV